MTAALGVPLSVYLLAIWVLFDIFSGRRHAWPIPLAAFGCIVVSISGAGLWPLAGICVVLTALTLRSGRTARSINAASQRGH